MPVDWPLAAEASLPSGFTVSRFASGLRTPRGLLVAPSGDVLVLERGSGVSCVTILWDGGAQRASCVASATGLNHGLAMAGGYLFASSITTVYRWEYDGRQRTPLLGRTVVVANMGTAADGSDLGANRGHDTRTLAFDSALRLYVSIGSYGNVDADSFRSRVRVFPGTTAPGATAVNFNDGEVWADGLRNEVGMAFDGYGTLWGVENGADNLVRDDMGDVHNDNPGEELNKLDASGAFYGYPYCWSEHTLPSPFARGATTQWAWPGSGGLMGAAARTDEWCRSTSNVVPPAMVMPAHVAPLGLAFVGVREVHLSALGAMPCTSTDLSSSAAEAEGAFPCEWAGDAIVPQHGSWNRNPPIGYAVVRLPFGTDRMPRGEVRNLLEHAGAGARWASANFRPVDARFDLAGRLLVSSDYSDEIVRIEFAGFNYTPPLPPNSTSPADSPQASSLGVGGTIAVIAGALVLVGGVALVALGRMRRARRGCYRPKGGVDSPGAAAVGRSAAA